MSKRIFTDYQNKMRTLTEISKLSHHSYALVYQRYNRGIRGDQLGAPLENKPHHIPWPDGHNYTIAELSQNSHVSKLTIQARYRRGIRGLALIQPVNYHRHTAS